MIQCVSKYVLYEIFNIKIRNPEEVGRDIYCEIFASQSKYKHRKLLFCNRYDDDDLNSIY